MQRLLGRFHCPRCFAMQSFFAVPGTPPTVQHPPMECGECEYVFDQTRVEHRDGSVQMRPTVAIPLRLEAAQELFEETRAHMLASGRRLETFTLREPPDATR